MHRLKPEHVKLAGAIAVLGERAPLGVAAELVGLGAADAVAGLDALIGAHLVEPAQGTMPEGAMLDFVHPLVGNAVYQQMSHADGAANHAKAVRLLADSGSSAERIVPHLLHLPGAR